MSRELQQLVFERSRNVNVNVSVGDKAENCDPGHWTVKASSLNNRGPLSQIHSVLSFHSRQQGSTFCPSASSLAHDRQEVNEDFFFFLFSSFSRVFCTQPGGAATVKNETKKKKNKSWNPAFVHTHDKLFRVRYKTKCRLSSQLWRISAFLNICFVILKSRRHMTLIIRVFSGQKKMTDLRAVHPGATEKKKQEPSHRVTWWATDGQRTKQDKTPATSVRACVC